MNQSAIPKDVAGMLLEHDFGVLTKLMLVEEFQKIREFDCSVQ